jgi:chromate transporter
MGATNLIPGPNSTEMAIHVGFVRGGWMGLVVAGVCFILPAVLITTAFAWLYVEHGQQPQVAPIVAGIKPAVLAIIFSAGWRLGRKAIQGWIVGVVFSAVLVASLCGVPEIPTLLGGSLAGTLALLWHRRRPPDASGAVALVATGYLPTRVISTLLAGTAATAVSLSKLGLFFLKVGCVLYGTGYVLIAYLQGGLVDQYGWLTQDQLLDAIAVGQLTPGPILSTATFIGYVVMAADGGHGAGLVGATVATVGVFLPSFVLVAITNPLVPRLRQLRWTAAFLDAVNAASIGLMAAVTVKLAWRVFFPSGAWRAPNWPSLLIAVAATAIVLRWKINAVWLVVGGAAAGIVCWLIGWRV